MTNGDVVADFKELIDDRRFHWSENQHLSREQYLKRCSTYPGFIELKRDRERWKQIPVAEQKPGLPKSAKVMVPSVVAAMVINYYSFRNKSEFFSPVIVVYRGKRKGSGLNAKYSEQYEYPLFPLYGEARPVDNGGVGKPITSVLYEKDMVILKTMLRSDRSAGIPGYEKLSFRDFLYDCPFEQYKRDVVASLYCKRYYAGIAAVSDIVTAYQKQIEDAYDAGELEQKDLKERAKLYEVVRSENYKLTKRVAELEAKLAELKSQSDSETSK